MIFVKPPFFCTDEYCFVEELFPSPIDALKYAEANRGCVILDGNGTTISVEQLRKYIQKGAPREMKKNKYTVDIHTDGSCRGNPGPGGYCGIIVMNGREKTVRGYDIATTNNRMELKAVLEAIKVLTAPCDITVHTDSQYLCTCSAHQLQWFEKTDRPNKELWIQLIKAGLSGKHNIHFVKVKGHSGEEYNERCDKIAKEQARKACHVLAGHIEG